MYRFDPIFDPINKALDKFLFPNVEFAFSNVEKQPTNQKSKNAYFFQREFNQLASTFFQVDSQYAEEKRESLKGGKKFRIFARALVFPIFFILLIILEIASRLRMIDEEENNKSDNQKSSENTYIKRDDTV